MKKIILLCMFSVLTVVGIGCTNQSETVVNNLQANVDVKEHTEYLDARKVVWDQLQTDQREFIDGTWEDGTLSTIKLTESMFVKQTDEVNTYVGVEVYAIDFPTKSTSFTNNVIVYADIENLKFIGNGLVD
ncbi:hypothetical protein [Guptibacillus algicola]|uniref:hypothetical protein n=1 Tax=Guptibacillus algicola TaxID=225844 RepID=UPI001CD3BE77|nr:hypothetical protein [Alkalihalobacillus algicola]MCA0985698.1 hypothetical protein [Alkalihalobacillus algicola]